MTFTAADKVYNGTAATITGSHMTGVQGLDDVTLISSGASAQFASKNIGTQTVTATGFTLGGAQGPDYVIVMHDATATIGAKALTVTGAVAQDRAYDGGTTATVN